MNVTKIGYARVSTDDQNLNMQNDALTKADCGEIYKEYASGKLIFHVFASMAEFERNLIRERSHAGLAAARARGRKGVRKPKLSKDQIKQIRAMLKDPAIRVMDIAKQYGVAWTTIFNAVGPVRPKRSVS